MLMEEHLNPLALTHLLQHTLRSLCIQENSQWIYAVFWRILPRNYPPPKWDGQGGAYDRTRGNRRNWIMVWEDGFCNFAASAADSNSEFQTSQGLQPELFFKMSHEIYNYGEGLIGKVAADQSHKWIYKEANDQEINFLSAWHNSADCQPRTWEAQFQSGVKTIALIAVREGVVQLGSLHKVIEDLNYIVLLRKKFSYIGSIPGVLLPHPSSSSSSTSSSPPFPYYKQFDSTAYGSPSIMSDAPWCFQGPLPTPSPPTHQFYDYFNQQPLNVTPSMSSLEALLSKLPSVVPPQSSQPPQFLVGMEGTGSPAKEEEASEHQGYNVDHEKDVGDSSSSMSYHQYNHFHHGPHHHENHNLESSGPDNGY